MRARHLLIGNWKMNLGPRQGVTFASELKQKLGALTSTDVWVAPPMLSLSAVAAALEGSPIQVGSQNVHWAHSGAFTGETSPDFLTEIGATFSLLGHSERRTLFGETSSHVAQRTKSALAAHLTAVVCIGETEDERTQGLTDRVLEDQLIPVLENVSESTCRRVIIAYEPVWAIGTGKVATIKEIVSAHRFIHEVWNRRGLPSGAVILYGGSVNPGNFSEILALPEVDGALVGGASIKLDQWLEMVAIAERTPIAAGW